MLGKKNKNETSGFAADTGATSIIIPKTRITGTFQSEGNIRLDGELEGKILCKGKVVIGPGGVVKGDVECKDADVSGIVHGNIIATGTVHINNGAQVHGDIKAENLQMDIGAKFSGRSMMQIAAVAQVSNHAERAKAENTEKV